MLGGEGKGDVLVLFMVLLQSGTLLGNCLKFVEIFVNAVMYIYILAGNPYFCPTLIVFDAHSFNFQHDIDQKLLNECIRSFHPREEMKVELLEPVSSIREEKGILSLSDLHVEEIYLPPVQRNHLTNLSRKSLACFERTI